jgi:hypothetical protein
MLSIQNSPTNKTRLRYVAPPSDIPYTCRTVFVKPTVPEPPPIVVDKGKDIINVDLPVTQKLPTIRRSPICHHCRLSEHVRPQCFRFRPVHSMTLFWLRLWMSFVSSFMLSHKERSDPLPLGLVPCLLCIACLQRSSSTIFGLLLGVII